MKAQPGFANSNFTKHKMNKLKRMCLPEDDGAPEQKKRKKEKQLKKKKKTKKKKRDGDASHSEETSDNQSGSDL